jgi:predicted esterase
MASEPESISVLALHGSEGTADSVSRILELWEEDMELGLKVTALNAPHPKPPGYCWWVLPPSVRSFNAAEYDGFDESSNLVLRSMSESRPDLVFGHSQGAILVAALLALRSVRAHPRLGYILNGVAWPNPYTDRLDGGSTSDDRSLDSVRVLLISGERDAINPPDQARRVAAALKSAGADVTVVFHGSGHAVPVPSGSTSSTITTASAAQSSLDATMARVRDWILGGGGGSRL